MIDYESVKSALSMLYEGTCKIEQYVSSEDENGLTRGTWQAVLEGEPCHLAFLEAKEASDGERAIASASARLFLYSDLEIKEGSRVSVTQHGSTYHFKHSGVALKFSSHQELDLVGEEYV